MKRLTDRQKKILEFIDEFTTAEGMSPTVYEIGQKFGIKTSTVFAHLRALQRKNQLTRTSKARSIALKQGIRTHLAYLMPVPLLGKLVAEMPVDAPELCEGAVFISKEYSVKYPGDKFFALRASGESMRDLGIFDNDIIIIRQTRSVRSGDMVVALVNNEVTVKSFYPLNNGKVELRPANADYRTQLYDAFEVNIQGKVVALQREYSL